MRRHQISRAIGLVVSDGGTVAEEEPVVWSVFSAQ
jgi:hypothetical protein